MSTMPVVVGVDGSEGSMRAAEWAAREAARRGAPLRIVSAPAPLPPKPSPRVPEVAIANTLRGMAAQNLSLAIERAEEVSHGLSIETGLLSWPPAVTVTDSGHGASMLVLGARGSGGFGAMILGSLSRHCVTHAPCPVVIVREETMGVQRQVAVGIRDPQDAQGAGQGALAFAFEEAALRRAELLVVHTWHGIPPGLPAMAGQAYDPELTSATARRQLQDMLVPWQEKYPAVTVSLNVAQARPARMLASLSARADLTVIGKHNAASLGPIHNGVLIHAHGPVAIVPDATSPSH